MKTTTLVYLFDREKNSICLGMKKRGFGNSKWNGFGGKVLEGEDIYLAALREVSEETDNGVIVDIEDLNEVASINFLYPHQPDWDNHVHVFLVERWDGNPLESEEMRPEWFDISNIPYNRMWPDDILWLPRVLAGERLSAEFSFDKMDELVDSKFSEYTLH